MLLTVLAAVCCSVVSTLITTQAGGSPTVTLILAVIGAALPPLIINAGPFHSLRVGVAVAVTLVGLAITYGGFTIVYNVTDEKPNLPLPGNGDSGGGGNASPTAHAEPGIGVSPGSVELTCAGADCARTVTITSTGTAPLRVGQIAVEASGISVAAENCAGKVLATDESCTVSVWMIAEGPPTRLVIHQNLPGAPSYVQVNRPSGPNISPTPPPATSSPG